MFEKLYQTLALGFDRVSKHLELSLKNSAAPHFSTSVLGVWKHDQTLVRVFDILRIESVAQHSTAPHYTAERSTTLQSTEWYGTAQLSTRQGRAISVLYSTHTCFSQSAVHCSTYIKT